MKKALIIFLLSLCKISASSQIVYSQFSNPAGKATTTSSGLCFSCSISNELNVVDNDISNNATIVMSAGIVGASRGIRAKLPSLVPGNTKAGFYINIGSVVSSLPTVTLTTYKSNAARETIITNGNVVSLLGGGLGYVCATTGSALDYDEVGISFTSGALTVGLSVSVFYAFGGGSTCPVTALPVKKIVLSVSIISNTPSITWAAEDDGNIKYELQRKTNEGSFKTIHTETSPDNIGPKEFHFSDIDANAGLNYYRILATDDKSLSVLYSRTVSINLHSNLPGTIKMYPNPVTGNEFNIIFNQISNEQYRLQIIDKTGRFFYNEYFKSSGNNSSTIKLKSHLAAGIYIIRIVNESKKSPTLYEKLIVL